MSSVFNYRRGTALLLTSDSFVAPDSTPLTVTDGHGQVDPLAWTVQEGNIDQIVSDRAACTGPAVGVHLTTVDPGFPNVVVDCDTIVTQGAGLMSSGLAFRWTDDSNYLFAQAVVTGDFNLWKVVAGTPIQLGSTVIGGPANPQYDLRIIAEGPSLTVQRNGLTIITAIDAFNDTATVCGLYANDTTFVSPTTLSWGPFSVSIA